MESITYALTLKGMSMYIFILVTLITYISDLLKNVGFIVLNFFVYVLTVI